MMTLPLWTVCMSPGSLVRNQEPDHTFSPTGDASIAMASYPTGGGGSAPPPMFSPAAPVPPPTKRYRASDSPATAAQQQQQGATPGPSPSVDDAIARRRAELRRLQALRAQPTPKAPPRGASGGGGDDILDLARSHLAERRRDHAPMRRREGTVGVGSEGYPGDNSGQSSRQSLPGPPPGGGGAGPRRTSSLYGRGGGDFAAATSAAAAAASVAYAPPAVANTSTSSAPPAASASAPPAAPLPSSRSHHPPMTKPPPKRAPPGAARSSSAPPRRPPSSSGPPVGPPPPPRGDTHNASAGVTFASSATATATAGSRSRAPPPMRAAPPPVAAAAQAKSNATAGGGAIPPPNRVTFTGSALSPTSPPLGAAASGGAGVSATSSTGASGGGSSGASPPAARRLDLSPFEQKKGGAGSASAGAPPPTGTSSAPPTGTSSAPPIGLPQQRRAMPGHVAAMPRIPSAAAPPPSSAASMNEPPNLVGESPSTSKDDDVAAAKAGGGPPPPVSTPPGPSAANAAPPTPFVTDTIRKADRVLQDDVPTPKHKTTTMVDAETYTGRGDEDGSTSLVSGLTSEMASPPPLAGAPPIPPTTDGSNKSARSTTSRKEVLTSMFLGADSPATTKGGLASASASAAAPPQDTASAEKEETKPKKSAQLRLMKELRLTKEANINTLKDVAKLETEVATLRAKHGDLDRSSSGLPAMGAASRSHGDLETLVQIAEKDGEAEAMKWAANRLEQQKHSRSSTSLNSIGLGSPPGLPYTGIMSPLTSPRERGIGGGTAVATMTESVGGGTPGIRRRVQTPHPRRKGRSAGDGASSSSVDDTLPDTDLLIKAAESIPHEFVSDLATYYVRVPYVPSQPEDAATPGSPDPWELHGVVSSPRFYTDVADATRASTIEVMARIVSDGSVAVLHDACSIRHNTAGGNGSNDFRNVDTMDGPLGCVMYIDVDGTEREYWLDAIYEEAQATREAYCSSLLSAASALKAAGPSMAAAAAPVEQQSPPAMMPPSGFPAPMQQPPRAASYPPPQKSPTADACVGTEGMAFSPPAEKKKEPAPTTPDKKKNTEGKREHPPVEFDDGSGSADALSMMLGLLFSTVFNVVFFFLVGLPVRVVKYGIILVALYITLATVWLYLADDNGALALGAAVDYGNFFQPSLW